MTSTIFLEYIRTIKLRTVYFHILDAQLCINSVYHCCVVVRYVMIQILTSQNTQMTVSVYYLLSSVTSICNRFVKLPGDHVILFRLSDKFFKSSMYRASLVYLVSPCYNDGFFLFLFRYDRLTFDRLNFVSSFAKIPRSMHFHRDPRTRTCASTLHRNPCQIQCILYDRMLETYVQT